MNPMSGILSYSSTCFQCKNLIFHDFQLNQNINNDTEITFYRLLDNIHLFCQRCGEGILGNEYFGIECFIFNDIFCICIEENFQIYRLNLSSVLLRTREVIEVELQMWTELSFHRRHIVRARARVSQIFFYFL